MVLCARGGYGASDLLALIPWEELSKFSPKLLIGFSDISAIHSALYTKLNWPSLHGPMPATVLWPDKDHTPDVEALFTIINGWLMGKTVGSIPLIPISPKPPTLIKGALFGGCFTVLTNLIGTPYFPDSLANHIVFIEDTDEHPARLMRAFNQWLQSGALNNVAALVVGHLRNMGQNIPDCAEFVLKQFALRSTIPVFHSPQFGHTKPNFPIMLGSSGVISGDTLSWTFDQSNFDPINNKRGIT